MGKSGEYFGTSGNAKRRNGDMSTGNQPLTFISYSRADSEFALELANELRSSDFNIWLDQLDIPPGGRWDDEVERALRHCDIFMVILTPHSIDSNNVKDEIGYAIDSNKRILPVLLENAAVPFRLRRFQYVDFTGKNHEDGIEAAKQLLKKQVDKILSTGDWVPAAARTDKPRILPQRPVDQQRQVPPLENKKQILVTAVPGIKAETKPQSFWAANIIPLLLSLGFFSTACVFAGWFFWSALKPGQPTALPSTILPTTSPVNSPAVPQVPSSLPVSTATPTFKPIDTPTFTFTPVVLTDTAIPPMTAEKFVVEYFNIVANNHDLNKGWTLLTNDFQNQDANGWDSYSKFWNTVSHWDYSSIQVDYNSPPRVRVLISFTLYYNYNHYPSQLSNKHYCLIQANTPEGWQFDARKNCP